MDRGRHKPSRQPRRQRWVIWLVALIALMAAYPVASWYTRRPAFCNVCHEMSPYYDAWQSGVHAEVACVDCHVDPGLLADVLHKPYELREVWLHFTTRPTFPLARTIELPNDRCLRCHDGVIDPGITGFDHEAHRSAQVCKNCHTTAGHGVTAEALGAAGILNAEVQAALDARTTLSTGAGTAVAEHVAVVCSSCHDMAAAACESCHEPPGGHPVGACLDCHLPGAAWTFAHTTRTDCTSCHAAPANHFGTECAKCHAPGTPWASAEFSHPRIEGGEHTYRSFDCAECHPDGYASSNCTCHDGKPPEDD